MSIGRGANDIIGKGVIVHKDADDFTTQPTGNSGVRVACGVIRKA
jgi:Cu-Zn family superoxide dismutase